MAAGMVYDVSSFKKIKVQKQHSYCFERQFQLSGIMSINQDW